MAGWLDEIAGIDKLNGIYCPNVALCGNFLCVFLYFSNVEKVIKMPQQMFR